MIHFYIEHVFAYFCMKVYPRQVFKKEKKIPQSPQNNNITKKNMQDRILVFPARRNVEALQLFS